MFLLLLAVGATATATAPITALVLGAAVLPARGAALPGAGPQHRQLGGARGGLVLAGGHHQVLHLGHGERGRGRGKGKVSGSSVRLGVACFRRKPSTTQDM